MSDEITKTYASGRAYMEAAKLIDDSEIATGRDYLIAPTHTCLGLAIELLLKSVAMHQGVDEKKLKGVTVRHDLEELRKLTASHGFTYKTKAVDEIINHINQNYSKHEYRYFQNVPSLNKVNVKPAFAALNTFIDEVADYIGIPKAPQKS